MLVEIGAANAAFAVIKEAVNHSGDLLAAGKALFDYFDNKSEIQKSANKKGNGSDLEEFMALEQLRQQEEHLREMMIYAGRPGMWDDWLKFQAEAARNREAKRKELLRKKLARQKAAIQIFWYSCIAGLITILTGIVTWIVVNLMGRK